MPLILMCGFPSSGKTTRVRELKKHFELSHTTLVIEERFEDLSCDKNSVFTDSQKEKQLRDHLKSEVRKHLTKDNVVILDSANYIKGYRYEMYCLSKELKSTLCLVHCDVTKQDCFKFNELRPTCEQYYPDVLEALTQRFEPPNERNRWDSPLFITHKEEMLQLMEIDNTLFLKKPPLSNFSTQAQPLLSANYLYDLDKITQDIVKAIVDVQKLPLSDDCITVPHAQEKVHLTAPVSSASLRKIQKQFITYTKTYAQENQNVPNAFVQFLNKTLSGL